MIECKRNVLKKCKRVLVWTFIYEVGTNTSAEINKANKTHKSLYIYCHKNPN